MDNQIKRKPHSKKTDMNTFFSPPVVRSVTQSLDRALFAKTVPIAAACVRDVRTIPHFRKELMASSELLHLPRVSPVHAERDGRRWLLLRPEVEAAAPDTWSPALSAAVKDGQLEVVPWKMKLDYDFYSYVDVMKSMLPEELHEELPVGFNTAGHVAHLNLREQYLPYKTLIARVLMDKNPAIRTVINKLEDVGSASAFRTFPYEVLAGPADLNVEVSENGCVFAFDYGRVYWNTKLNLEHARLVELFRPGEVVCDAMAGVGPFAIPAGRKGVFVLANDLNPDSFAAMERAIKRNKASQFVKSFNEDAGEFIARSGKLVLEASRRGDCAIVYSKPSHSGRNAGFRSPPLKPEPTRTPIPPTISHYVMNLPGSAISFLHHFRGVYRGHEGLFAAAGSPGSGRSLPQLPLVHVYCFCSEKEDDECAEAIQKRIYGEIGVMLEVAGDGTAEGQLAIADVRDVAPNKKMFCATFRLPREVAFDGRVAE